MTTTFPFGAFLGQVTISGVSLRVFSNGEKHFVSSQESYDHEGNYLGLRYQCVELVRRYLYKCTGKNGAQYWRGIAGEMYDNAEKNELESFPFSQAEKGDVLCFDGGKWGHVALVSDADENFLTITQQNFFNDERDLSFQIPRSAQVISDGDDAFVPLGCMRPSSVVSVPKQHDCLADIRHEIDLIDRNLLELLSRRFLCSSQVVKMKQQSGLSVFDENREKELFENIRISAQKYGLPAHIAESIFERIVSESRKFQEEKG